MSRRIALTITASIASAEVTHMHRTLALLVAALAMLTAPSARAAAPRWTLAIEAPIEHRASVATFVDEKNGITVGYAGASYVTHDGGKTWQAAANVSACRFGVEAVPGAAFSAGNQGNVRRSADGGEHWTAVAGFGRAVPGHARFLSFADAKRGMIASPQELALTLDGAETWTKLALPDAIGLVAALSASDESGSLRLRVLDENGALFTSADQGKTWTEAKGPLAAPVMESMATPWAAMRFHGAEGVLAAFTDDKAGVTGHVYRTQDGGKTWTEDGLAAPIQAGSPNLSWDGKVLTTLGGKVVRVYRLN